jgi:hypothetical protein
MFSPAHSLGRYFILQAAVASVPELDSSHTEGFAASLQMEVFVLSESRRYLSFPSQLLMPQ